MLLKECDGASADDVGEALRVGAGGVESTVTAEGAGGGMALGGGTGCVDATTEVADAGGRACNAKATVMLANASPTRPAVTTRRRPPLRGATRGSDVLRDACEFRLMESSVVRGLVKLPLSIAVTSSARRMSAGLATRSIHALTSLAVAGGMHPSSA